MRRRQRWQVSLRAFDLAVAGIVFCVTTAFADEPSRDWPRWRGPKADGVADNRKLPTQWSPSENIRWSVTLPGWGTSSPVVYGGRVFVTSELNQEGKKSLLTLGIDRAEGDEPPADCRDAGFFVEEIGLQVRSGVSSGISESADA